MTKKRLLIMILLTSALTAGAQSVRLTRYDAPSALYLDGNNLVNYNRYEHWRFSLGMYWVTPNQNAAEKKNHFGQWKFRGYAAYGTGDHGWKYGASAALQLPGVHHHTFELSALKDLDRAASRQLSGYEIFNPTNNTSYLSNRYMGVKGGQLKYDLDVNRSREVHASLSLRQTWEDARFSQSGLYYPEIDPAQQQPVSSFTELGFKLEISPVTDSFDMEVGKLGFTFYTHPHTSILSVKAGREYNYDLADTRYYLRGIYQYLANYNFCKGLSLFGQIGFSTAKTPYSRMFDISGTGNSYYFFRRSFLTVLPNTFTANLYTHLCLNYTMPNPLWNLDWSAPRPFAQVNLMWGRLYGQDETGWVEQEGMMLQAPYLGMAEPALGVKSLVRYGVTKVGVAVAYQLCPESAAYYRADPKENFAITVVADISVN